MSLIALNQSLSPIEFICSQTTFKFNNFLFLLASLTPLHSTGPKSALLSFQTPDAFIILNMPFNSYFKLQIYS